MTAIETACSDMVAILPAVCQTDDRKSRAAHAPGRRMTWQKAVKDNIGATLPPLQQQRKS